MTDPSEGIPALFGPDLGGASYYPGSAEFDAYRIGFQLQESHQPCLVVAAKTADDVAAAMRYSAAKTVPIAVQATGHGLAGSLDGEGVLVSTRQMNAVHVDAGKGTAWVEAGATWRDVISASSPHGLAPLSGSMPGVGAVSYTLGGGIGLMARRYGFAADHVNRLDIVTADGLPRTLSADQETDLFWAVRGGGGNFGIVTGMEIELMPVARLFGGGLMFDLDQTPDLIPNWLQWTRNVPDEMTSAVTTLGFSGRHMGFVQICFLGASPAGDELVEPLRAMKPKVDGLQEIPYSRSHTVFSEPDQAHAYVGDNLLLRSVDEKQLISTIAFSAPSRSIPLIVSIRHLGGALAGRPRRPNAVGHRSASYALSLVSPTTKKNARPARSLQTELLAGWSGQAIGSSPNFTFGRTDRGTAMPAFEPKAYQRLQKLKSSYDPDGLLRPSFGLD